MVDKITIINGAIALIGGEAIASLPASNNINDIDAPSRSRWAARLFDTTYDSVLELWPWNDVRRRRKLTRDSEDPAFGYGSQYVLADQVLKVVGVQSCGERWEREGRKLLCSAGDTLNIISIERVDPATIGGLLADLVSHRLAYRVCMGLSDSAGKLELLKKLTKDQLAETLIADNWEASAKVMLASGWWLAANSSHAPEQQVLGEPRAGWLDGG